MKSDCSENAIIITRNKGRNSNIDLPPYQVSVSNKYELLYTIDENIETKDTMALKDLVKDLNAVELNIDEDQETLEDAQHVFDSYNKAKAKKEVLARAFNEYQNVYAEFEKVVNGIKA